MAVHADGNANGLQVNPAILVPRSCSQSGESPIIAILPSRQMRLTGTSFHIPLSHWPHFWLITCNDSGDPALMRLRPSARSRILGRKAALWEPLAAGFLAATVHAGAGMVLVGALSLVYRVIARLGDTEFAAAYIDAATFGLLIVLAVMLISMKIKALLSGGGATLIPLARHARYTGLCLSQVWCRVQARP